MKWNTIESINTLDEAVNKSSTGPVMIFKHSIHCGISAAVLNRLEEDWQHLENVPTPYFVDLIKYRTISNHIAEKLQVIHESPQAIIVLKGKAIGILSHYAISFKKILELTNKN